MLTKRGGTAQSQHGGQPSNMKLGALGAQEQTRLSRTELTGPFGQYSACSSTGRIVTLAHRRDANCLVPPSQNLHRFFAEKSCAIQEGNSRSRATSGGQS
jgi:hypothetical protein